MPGRGAPSSGANSEPEGSLEGNVFIVKLDEINVFQEICLPKDIFLEPLSTYNMGINGGTPFALKDLKIRTPFKEYFFSKNRVHAVYNIYTYVRTRSCVHICVCVCVWICTASFCWLERVKCFHKERKRV
jgi:hypothetical protein